MKNKVPFIYYLIAIIPPLTGAGNFLVAKATAGDIGPMALLYWRWAVAWLVLFPFVIKDCIHNKELLKKHANIIVITALPGIVLFNAFMYTAVQHTTSINASIIANTFPIFIVILSYFILREPISPLKSFGIVLALVGTMFIMTNGEFAKLNGLFDNGGDLIALGGAFLFGCYAVALRYRPKEIKVATFTFATITVGCILIAPLYIWEIVYVKPLVLSLPVVGAILFVAIPVSIIGVISWNISITHLGATTAGLIFYLAPVFNVILAQLFLDEKFTMSHLAGLCLILLGINLPLLGGLRREKR
jgi:drug/metabolite transporter (DMT)-like permease